MKKFLIMSIIGLLFFTQIRPVQAKKIALTFDADLTPLMLSRIKSGQIKSYYNDKISAYVIKNNIPITLFLTGLFAETYGDKLKILAGYPYVEIENHSYDHKSFEPKCFGLGLAADKTMEITKANDIIQNITGKRPAWFRFPGGCHRLADDDLVIGLKMKIASWTIVSGDAFNRNVNSIVNRVLSKAVDGAVVVMHFGSVNAPGTGKALPLIVDGLKKQNFELVTLNQLYQ